MIKRPLLTVIAVSTALVPSHASAQGVNLTGYWQCVAMCEGPPGRLGSISQNEWQLNMVNEAGQESRGWVDYPGRIWLYAANQGAIYSPDGRRLQFDRGTLWMRVPEAVVLPRNR